MKTTTLIKHLNQKGRVLSNQRKGTYFKRWWNVVYQQQLQRLANKLYNQYVTTMHFSFWIEDGL